MSTDSTPMIRLNNVHKWYGDYHALDGVELTVKRGDETKEIAFKTGEGI